MARVKIQDLAIERTVGTAEAAAITGGGSHHGHHHHHHHDDHHDFRQFRRHGFSHHGINNFGRSNFGHGFNQFDHGFNQGFGNFGFPNSGIFIGTPRAGVQVRF